MNGVLQGDIGHVFAGANCVTKLNLVRIAKMSTIKTKKKLKTAKLLPCSLVTVTIRYLIICEYKFFHFYFIRKNCRNYTKRLPNIFKRHHKILLNASAQNPSAKFVTGIKNWRHCQRSSNPYSGNR